MERPFPALTITDKAARSLQAGHPWVYAGEILADGAPRESAPCAAATPGSLTRR